ncbi:hypothetical protein PILCRDRAFT_93681 [Piloderma croceum F 1598]|uniref:Uncharacterized protein n=1 Tax=Piloderma croceum (strain F 1598) TaxID=765440 RepID=A0A0C3EV12_PILCF|nr:hypothetical protein PILCRDRAFT_93681 [Piloderma croceum F 1598]
MLSPLLLPFVAALFSSLPSLGLCTAVVVDGPSVLKVVVDPPSVLEAWGGISDAGFEDSMVHVLGECMRLVEVKMWTRGDMFGDDRKWVDGGTMNVCGGDYKCVWCETIAWGDYKCVWCEMIVGGDYECPWCEMIVGGDYECPWCEMIVGGDYECPWCEMIAWGDYARILLY